MKNHLNLKRPYDLSNGTTSWSILVGKNACTKSHETVPLRLNISWFRLELQSGGISGSLESRDKQEAERWILRCNTLTCLLFIQYTTVK